MSEPRKNVVTVVIAGEDYTLRADASPDYTRECASYLDRTIAEILRQGSLVEPQKGILLAALSLTDQLFQARQELEAARREGARFAARLAADIEKVLPAGDLAAAP